jgi:Cu(I)/Ag(I) efflux system membrane fusion protein
MEVDGRIEHSYVHILHQRVHKGDLLFDLYSPELLALQRQYLQSLNSGDSNLARVQADNLQHLGMDAAALIHLRKVRQPNPYLKVYSPLSGIVEPWSVQRFSRTMNVEWTSMSQPGSDETEAAPEWALYPGMYVHAGQKLFVVQSMTKPWVVLQIPASQASRAAAGDSVVLKPLSGLGGSLRTALDYVPLNVDATSQSSPVRIYLSELPPGWTLGMNLIAQWSPQTSPRHGAHGWYLPEGSLKWLGDRYVAWVQDARDSMLFRVQDVRVGTHSGGWYQILAGLDSSSRVVTEANLVQDNEIYIH